MWLIKNYNVCLVSSGRNLVSKVGRERGPPSPPTHTHTQTCAQNMDYIIGLLSFLKKEKKKGRLTINNSTVHVTFQLQQTSKYNINTDSKLWSTYPVVTLYIKGTVKEQLFTTQLVH